MCVCVCVCVCVLPHDLHNCEVVLHLSIFTECCCSERLETLVICSEVVLLQRYDCVNSEILLFLHKASHAHYCDCVCA